MKKMVVLVEFDILMHMSETIVKMPKISAATAKKYSNQWVAFSPDYKRVLAAGARLVDVDKKVGSKKAIFMRMLPDVFFAPHG